MPSSLNAIAQTGSVSLLDFMQVMCYTDRADGNRYRLAIKKREDIPCRR